MELAFSRNFLGLGSKTDAWIFETEQGPGFGLEIYSVEAGQWNVIAMQLHCAA